jgi:VIT1/CCC1 family predicted Fe2+/Mn2+ transporter
MEESGKQKRIDAYLSLLQAGLGMMGGSSPFAAVNIGQGAATGVAAQMAARKSQVADENAILTGQLGLSRAELYEKMRRDALKQQYEKDVAAQKLGRERLGLQGQALNVRMGDLKRKAADDWENSPRKAQLEADLAKQKKNWRQDPKLLGQFESARGRFINEFVNVGQADNILSSSQL